MLTGYRLTKPIAQWILMAIVVLTIGIHAAPLDRANATLGLERRGQGSSKVQDPTITFPSWIKLSTRQADVNLLDYRLTPNPSSKREVLFELGKKLGQGKNAVVYDVKQYHSAGFDTSSTVAKVFKNPGVWGTGDPWVEVYNLQTLGMFHGGGRTPEPENKVVLLMQKQPGIQLTKTPQYLALKKSKKKDQKAFMDKMLAAYCNEIGKIAVKSRLFPMDGHLGNVVVKFKDDKSHTIESISPIDWGEAGKISLAKYNSAQIRDYCIQLLAPWWPYVPPE